MSDKTLNEVLGDDAGLYVVKIDGKYAIFNMTAFFAIGHAFKGNKDHHWEMHQKFIKAIADEKGSQVMVLADAITPENFIYEELKLTIEEYIRKVERKVVNLEAEAYFNDVQIGGNA